MYRLLFWLMLGAFAIGTEGFVIAGILPALAGDLRVSIAQGGQLVTVFSLTYAVAAPVLAVLAARHPRERVLRVAMAGFAAANIAAALAPGFAWLLAARALLAVFAGLYMSTAGAYAAMAVAPEKRGRAMAFVYMGLSVATVIGVPIGTLVGNAWGWRTTFGGVAVLSALALAGLCLPRPAQAAAPAATLAQRVAIARAPAMLRGLLTTTLCMAGAFALYTYLGALLQRAAGLSATQVALVLMLFGAGGLVGNMVGGHLADRKGPDWVTRRVPGMLVLVFAAVAAVATWSPPGSTAPLMIALIAVWGVVGWSFPPAQQLKLVQMAPQSAPVILSLNASALYVGISIGALAGSATIALASVHAIGWVAAVLEAAALLSASTLGRSARTRLQPELSR